MSPAVARFLLAAIGANASFYLLLTVVPMYVGAAAGLATGVLMLTTVAAELAAPRLIARLGRRRTFAVGLALLGIPVLALPVGPNLPVVLTVCGLRGVGFGLVVVLGSAWMATLVPADRRGAGLALYGVAVGAPAVVALPIGVWLAGQVGYPPVFLVAAVTPLLALVPLWGVPTSTVEPRPRVGVLRGLRSGELLRPALAFAATAAAAGIVVTFLPAAAPDGAAALVPTALLVQSLAVMAGRWWAGQHRPAPVLRLAVLVSALGFLLLAAAGRPLWLVAGAGLFGLGFGAAQNASITLMIERAEPGGYETASAVWNIGYDAGMGLGAAGFGLLAGQLGLAPSFAVVAALIPVALLALRSPSARLARARS